MVVVGCRNAFAVNRVGFGGPSFPLAFSVREAAGSWLVRATAAQAAELADVLIHAANDTIVVLGLGTNSFVDEDYAQWPLSRIAAEQGVACLVHQLGALATGVPGLSEEVIAFQREDLPRFLDGWSPYDLALADMPGSPDPDRIDELALVIGTADFAEPVLVGLPGSRLVYGGHDDCYVYIESSDPRVPHAVLTRLLALLVGSALASDAPQEVPEPNEGITVRLIEDSSHWTGRITAASADTVTVGLAAVEAPWRLADPIPERVDRTVVFDIGHRHWRLVSARMH